MAHAIDSTSSQNEPVLSESQLRDLSRDAKGLLPKKVDGSYQVEDINKYAATFRSVIDTCSAETLSTAQQVAAWNTLSTFVDQIALHQDVAVRSVFWMDDHLRRSLSIFLNQSTRARPKSIKQLLSSLTNAIQKTRYDDGTAGFRQDVVRSLLDTILRKNTEYAARPCFLLLSSLLRRDGIALTDVDNIIDPSSRSIGNTTLLKACMQWALEEETASAAGQLLNTALDKAEAGDVPSQIDNEPLWVTALLQTLSQQADRVDSFRHHLMPALFTRSHQGFLSLLHHLQIDKYLQNRGESPRIAFNGEFKVLLAALQVGNQFGLVDITNDTTLKTSECPLQLPVSLVAQLLRYADRSVRVAGLSMLIDTHTPSQAIHKTTLDTLRSNLPHLHADTDLSFRGELFSMTQRLLDRLRASTARKAHVQQQTAGLTSEESYQYEHDFVMWYKKFLMWELRPGASYQRHISALRCLGILMKSGVDQELPTDSLSKSARAGAKWPFSLKVVSDDLEEILIGMVLNSFDDVRQTTATLLAAHLASQNAPRTQQKRLQDALDNAERLMLASGRADQADAVAHYYTLLCSLDSEESERIFLHLVGKAEHMLHIATTDLGDAVQRYPLHGILTSLRYVLQTSRLRESIETDVYVRLSRMLHTVWHVVKPTLCDDAPEGFLPNDVASSAVVSSKIVLSYCWRALKEASLLTDMILVKLKDREDDLSRQYKTGLIELTFTQLAELRHRGAFSTVAQTWNRCCSLTDGILQLQSLFERVIALIQRETINTRRSAGMPSLLCGILIADGDNIMLDQAFAQLDTIARQAVQSGLDDESSLPQVHAMNCLKDILKNTKLASRSERFVPVALQLAADSLPSTTWAIRNCGLMLFRAVIDRLLGTNDSYEDETDVRSTMDFRQRRALLNQVLVLLPTTEQDAVLEGVFPALQLLQHSQLPQDCQEDVHHAIFALLENRSWLIRDKAARTLVTLLPSSVVLQEVSVRLEQGRTAGVHNLVHGHLLCLKHLRRAVQRQQDIKHPSGLSVVDELNQIHDLAQYLDTTSSCPAIRLTAHNIVREVSVDPDESTIAESHELMTLCMEQALQVISGPTMADSWLFGRSIWLEKQVEGNHESPEALHSAIEDFTTACESAICGTSLFSCESVSRALCRLDGVLGLLWNDTRGKCTVLRLCLVVYDLLNDDDEDIRFAAAQSAVKILALSKQDVMLEPLVASHRLSAFLVANNSTSAEFAEICLCRTFKFRTAAANITTLLRQASSHDTDLFAEEKQNLYLDETLEAKVWLQAAKKLPPSVYSAKDVDELTEWASAGLDALLTRAQDQRSGALDFWSASEAVFPVGLRIIYAIELLLELANANVRLIVRPSALREKLLKLEKVAVSAGLHPLWRSELERVSKLAALSGFSAIQSLLNSVVGNLASATTLQ